MHLLHASVNMQAHSVSTLISKQTNNTSSVIQEVRERRLQLEVQCVESPHGSTLECRLVFWYLYFHWKSRALGGVQGKQCGVRAAEAVRVCFIFLLRHLPTMWVFTSGGSLKPLNSVKCVSQEWGLPFHCCVSSSICTEPWTRAP